MISMYIMTKRDIIVGVVEMAMVVMVVVVAVIVMVVATVMAKTKVGL